MQHGLGIKTMLIKQNIEITAPNGMRAIIHSVTKIAYFYGAALHVYH